MIYDKIQEKNPELCGFKADDFDKEENKWFQIADMMKTEDIPEEKQETRQVQNGG